MGTKICEYMRMPLLDCQMGMGNWVDNTEYVDANAREPKGCSVGEKSQPDSLDGLDHYYSVLWH